MTLRVIDLSAPPPADDFALPGVVVGAGEIAGAPEYWLDQATFTLTEAPCDDRRAITVVSVRDTLAELVQRCGRWRTAYLVLSGHTIDAATALSWGLVDAVAQ
ncbi:hypothetical protein SKC42_24180 [Mycobacterium sp. 050134]